MVLPELVDLLHYRRMQAGFDLKHIMDTTIKIRTCIRLLAGFLAASHSVYAQSDLQQCARVEEDTARLECYDELTRAAAPEQPASPAVMDADDASGTVTIAAHNRSTGWHITLDNGQSWKQVGTASFVVSIGDACAITRGLNDNFLLQCGNRARRIQVRPELD